MFLEYYHKATPAERNEGLNWYTRAKDVAQEFADTYDVSLETTAGILAGVSQRISWERAIEMTELALEGRPVQHYAPIRDKIASIIKGDPPDEVLRGPKITAFYQAIMGDPDAIVLDAWMLSVTPHPRPTIKQYQHLANVLRKEAKQAGITPAQFQAIVWVVLRDRG